MRKLLSASAVIGVLVLAAGVVVATPGDNWTGEVVEAGCYVSQGAHGPDHVECAKRCFADGSAAGLLTEDGTLYILQADPDNAEPLETVKSMPAAQVTVEGTLSEEEDGTKVITVAAATPAEAG